MCRVALVVAGLMLLPLSTARAQVQRVWLTHRGADPGNAGCIKPYAELIDRYPDPKSEFLASEDSYLPLTFTRKPPRMTVEIKGLDGKVLDRKQFPDPSRPAAPRRGS